MSEIEKEMIKISKEEYKSLKENSNFLDCLKCVGVDNWDGYGDALQMLEDEY